MSREDATWPKAAERLARRVGRQERFGAALGPLGWALLVGGAASILLALTGVQAPWPRAVLFASMLLGVMLAVRAARRVERVASADAAWALDRVAGAKERGLVAATVPGPVGAEAAWASGRIAPPQVRLLPPRGLATALGGLLAVALALLLPAGAEVEGADAMPDVPGDQETMVTGAAAADSAARDEEARTDAERAEAAAAVRRALGLGPQAATDPGQVGARLEDPVIRQAAEDAAPEGSDLAALLAEGAVPDRVATALADGGDAEARAREARRQAAALRANAAILAVPPHRRAYLERYTWQRGRHLSAENGGR